MTNLPIFFCMWFQHPRNLKCHFLSGRKEAQNMLGMYSKFSLSISSSCKFLPIPVSLSFFFPSALQILDRYLVFKVKMQDFLQDDTC